MKRRVLLSFLLSTFVVFSFSLSPAGGQTRPIDQGANWRDGPKISPFDAIRWRESKIPEARIKGTWCELLELDGLPLDKLVAGCKEVDENDWQRRFGEDLIGIIVHQMNHPLGAAANVKVRDLQSGKIQVLERVEMTRENRIEVVRARFEAEQQPTTKPAAPREQGRLTHQEADEDLTFLQGELEAHYAYLTRRGVGYHAALADVRGHLGESITTSTLAIEIQKIIAQFGDGHSGVSDLNDALPAGYSPFLIEPTEQGLVAFREDRTGFVDADHPFVRALDGVAIEKWLAAAARMVPAGSPQFVQRNGAHFLRCINFLRQEMTLPSRDTLSVELESARGGSNRTMELPLAAKRPIYGDWPRSKSRILDGNIGYLRIASMEDEPDFLAGLMRSMQDFRQTRGLIIDVRGNGGGTRGPLREFFPFFMKADDAPHVANVAAYRLGPGEDPASREGFLADRALYPISSKTWSESQQQFLRRFAQNFKPQWVFPANQFSAWHYAMIVPNSGRDYYFYGRPVVILMDAGCFSATDIFLGAFKGWRNVTLMGSASGGGSGRVRQILLPHGSIRVSLCSMASFKPDGTLYEARGTAPDVPLPILPTDLIGKTDPVLGAAIARLSGT